MRSDSLFCLHLFGACCLLAPQRLGPEGAQCQVQLGPGTSGSVKNKSPFSFSLANSRQIAGREGSIVELGRRDRLLRSEPRSIDLTFPLLVARKPLKAP